jgi:type I site-specific restriction endonuclease
MLRREKPLTPEQKARVSIDALLVQAGWHVCGVIEAKKEGATLTGVEVQSGRYAQGLPTSLPALRRPLPFFWESTGVETLAQRLQQSGLQRIEARELRRYRQFYLAYPQIRETASPEAALGQFKLIAGDLGGEVAEL